MTARRPPRVSFLAIIAGAAALMALSASRAVAAPVDPEVAASDPGASKALSSVVTQSGPSAPEPTAVASIAPRGWLRDTARPVQATVVAAPDHSPWRAAGVLVVLSGLGLAALAARRRRVAAPVLPESATRVRVLSSARVGPKASAVVAEVGGRVMLLGVTDSHVARLAWLDAEREPAPRRARSRPVSSLELADEPSRDPVETADADEPAPARSMASRFGEVLDRALGVRPAAPHQDFRANPGVAALLAAGVADVVETPSRGRRSSRAYRDAPPEDQVAGLAQRRRRS
jgi:flagellar biogenesis protein FliO